MPLRPDVADGQDEILRELMLKAGLKVPPEDRTLESLCIVDVCKLGYDPMSINNN